MILRCLQPLLGLTLASFIGHAHADYLGHRLLTEPHKYWVHPEQLGVFHTVLSGGLSIPAAQAKADSDVTLNGTMHVFMKAVKDVASETVLLRGFAYWEDAYQPNFWADLKIDTPKVFTKWVPEMHFKLPMRQSNPRSSIKMRVVRAPDDTKPLGLFAKLPEKHADRYVLEIEDWKRSWPVTEMVSNAQEPVETGTQPLFYTVVGQFYDISHPLRYLKLHCDWHHLMGFNGTIMYLHAQHLLTFANDAVGQLLVNQKRAILVKWDPLANVENRYTYDQGIAHNHALLALWKQNAWLFLTDLDELFSTEVPRTVQDLLKVGGCLRETGGDLILLEEYDTLCTECFSSSEEGEERIWVADWSLGPIAKYTMRKQTPLSVKGLVYADRTMQYFVHGGHVLDTSKFNEKRLSGTTCAYVTHFRNLVYRRVKPAEASQYEKDVTSWQWPLTMK